MSLVAIFGGLLIAFLMILWSESKLCHPTGYPSWRRIIYIQIGPDATKEERDAILTWCKGKDVN